MNSCLTVLSLGWGVQSYTLAVMVALGELPPINAAIHADTLHERSATYTFASRWTSWLEARGVPVVTVHAPELAQAQNLRDQVLGHGGIPAYTALAPRVMGVVDQWNMVAIPARTSSAKGGMLRRQCTQRWKVAPLRRWLGGELERLGLAKMPSVIELWLGISLDEVERMRPSDVRYIIHRWPLVERRMTRRDCARWLERHGLEVPPRSACVFCPYHDQASWRALKQAGGPDWDKAVAVDKAIRKARPPFDLYLHQERRPLAEVDLRTAEECGQLSFVGEDCSGVCFV